MSTAIHRIDQLRACKSHVFTSDCGDRTETAAKLKAANDNIADIKGSDVQPGDANNPRNVPYSTGLGCNHAIANCTL